MAEAGAGTPSRPSAPLENLTNETQKAHHASQKRLRRTRSSRALYRRLDSSESVPSFRCSIWDADVVRSDEQHEENHPSSPDISPTTPKHPRVDFPPFLSLECLDELSDLPVQAQRSAPFNHLSPQTLSTTVFRPTQLEPIIEQRSVASLRSTLSRIRLGQNPASHVAVVRQHHSPRSLHPSQQQESSWSFEKSLPAPSYQRRAFSLDDLDCFKFSSLDCAVKRTRSSTTSSDPGLLASIAKNGSHPAEPRRPSHPPPERAPTPPGVPSFGSPDAINYFNRPRARSPSWWRIGRSRQPGLSPPNASVAAAALAANLNSPPPQPAGTSGSFRRFTLFNLDFPPPSSMQPRRASLPAGVLCADDGTFVRGRFGGRVSGHGISSRGLDGHPIQRAANLAMERKDSGANESWYVPRQRESGQRQDQETVMSGAVVPGNSVRRNASFSSLLTTWFSWETRSPGHLREAVEPPEVAEPPEISEQREPCVVDLTAGVNPERHREAPSEQVEPRIVDFAAGVDEFLHQNNYTATAPSDPRNSNDNDHPPAARHSIERINVPQPTTPTPPSAPPESKFWHCIHWFCICCCEMTETELDGCGWYGADRPWLRKTRESVRERREMRERGRKERSRERRDEADIAGWREERQMQIEREAESRRERRETNERREASEGWYRDPVDEGRRLEREREQWQGRVGMRYRPGGSTG